MEINESWIWAFNQLVRPASQPASRPVSQPVDLMSELEEWIYCSSLYFFCLNPLHPARPQQNESPGQLISSRWHLNWSVDDETERRDFLSNQKRSINLKADQVELNESATHSNSNTVIRGCDGNHNKIARISTIFLLELVRSFNYFTWESTGLAGWLEWALCRRFFFVSFKSSCLPKQSRSSSPSSRVVGKRDFAFSLKIEFGMRLYCFSAHDFLLWFYTIASLQLPIQIVAFYFSALYHKSKS